MQRGQAFDAFKLLIAAVVAGAIIVIILQVMGGLDALLPVDTSQFDTTQAEITEVTMYPAGSTQGTVFTVNANVISTVAGRTQCFAPPKIVAIIEGKEATMHDDGKHGDRRPRDCYYGGTWDSSTKGIGEYQAKVFVEDKLLVSKESDTITFNITDNACVTVEDHGDPETKLDIVFVGHGYTDLNLFDSDVRTHKDFLLSTSPFPDYRDRINVHEVRMQSDFGCYIDHSLIYCNDDRITQVATQCPVDEIIVLLNTEEISGTANPHAYVTRPYPEITVHEFGHSFGPEQINLADEYAYGMSITQGNMVGNPPNCAPAAACPAGWECVLVDKFGMAGCTFEEWVRPIAFNTQSGVSVMEGASVSRRSDPSQAKPVGYNEPSKAHLRKLLEDYS